MTPRYRDFKSLRDCGLTPKEIAQIYRVSHNHVLYVLKHYRSPEAYQAHLERARRRSDSIRRRKGIPARKSVTDWYPSAVALKSEGLSAAQIGHRLGKTKNQIIGALWRHADKIPATPSPTSAPRLDLHNSL